MLRLVHPAKQGQETRPSWRRKSGALTPTIDKQRRIYAALVNIARAYGGRDFLASVMGVSRKILDGRAKPRSYAFAVLLARARGIPVEQVLSGKPHDAGTCALCGRKGGTP